MWRHTLWRRAAALRQQRSDLAMEQTPKFTITVGARSMSYIQSESSGRFLTLQCGIAAVAAVASCGAAVASWWQITIEQERDREEAKLATIINRCASWKESLVELKEKAVVEDQNDVMLYPIQCAKAQMRNKKLPQTLKVPERQLEAGRQFALSVFEVAFKARKGSALELELQRRKLFQATNAVWFALFWDYIQGYNMKIQEKHARKWPTPHELLQQDMKVIYHTLIEYGLDDELDYLMSFQQTLQAATDFGPFIKSGFDRLAPDTRQMLLAKPRA